jgi:hypothetical protein
VTAAAHPTLSSPLNALISVFGVAGGASIALVLTSMVLAWSHKRLRIALVYIEATRYAYHPISASMRSFACSNATLANGKQFSICTAAYLQTEICNVQGIA